jgi:hypothetical protein
VSETLDLLRSMFPGKLMLTVEDVARVLGLPNGRAGREAVSAALRNGDVLPGLRKVIGRWRVPMVSLAKWLDGLSDQPATARPPASVERGAPIVDRTAQPVDRGRGRQPNKVRDAARKERAVSFLGAVLACLDRADFAAELPPGPSVGGRSTL